MKQTLHLTDINIIVYFQFEHIMKVNYQTCSWCFVVPIYVDLYTYKFVYRRTMTCVLKDVLCNENKYYTNISC